MSSSSSSLFTATLSGLNFAASNTNNPNTASSNSPSSNTRPFSTFTLFPSLPLDLRVHIWSLVPLQPRIISIHPGPPQEHGISYTRSAPAPGVLYANQESRHSALQLYHTLTPDLPLPGIAPSIQGTSRLMFNPQLDTLTFTHLPSLYFFIGIQAHWTTQDRGALSIITHLQFLLIETSTMHDFEVRIRRFHMLRNLKEIVLKRLDRADDFGVLDGAGTDAGARLGVGLSFEDLAEYECVESLRGVWGVQAWEDVEWGFMSEGEIHGIIGRGGLGTGRVATRGW